MAYIRCQFHQHFMSSFAPKKYKPQNLSTRKLCAKLIHEKTVHKMLVKFTQGIGFSRYCWGILSMPMLSSMIAGNEEKTSCFVTIECFRDLDLTLANEVRWLFEVNSIFGGIKCSSLKSNHKASKAYPNLWFTW